MESKRPLNSDLWSKIFVRDKDVVSRKIAGELFLVPIKGNLADMGNIFTLTTVAEYIWERLDGQKNLNDIRNDVVAQFDVDQKRADSDILEFIGELIEAGLIREGMI